MAISFIDTVASISLPRLVARVRGDRALEFLHAVTSQDVASLQPGMSTTACHLDDKGRVLAEVRVLVAPNGDVLLDAEEAARDGVERMARIAPLSECEIDLQDWTMTAVRGGGAHDAVAAEMELPANGATVGQAGDAIVVREDWGPPGFDILSPQPVAVDAPVGSMAEWERARIESGRPRFGADVTHDSLVNETPLADRAVSFTKGCYPGQESVARVRNLGQARWKMAVVHLPTDVELEPGAAIENGGRITSIARTDDAVVAIATIRADADDVTIGDVRASALVLD